MFQFYSNNQAMGLLNTAWEYRVYLVRVLFCTRIFWELRNPVPSLGSGDSHGGSGGFPVLR